jgi:hypothetical protein
MRDRATGAKCLHTAVLCNPGCDHNDRSQTYTTVMAIRAEPKPTMITSKTRREDFPQDFHFTKASRRKKGRPIAKITATARKFSCG